MEAIKLLAVEAIRILAEGIKMLGEFLSNASSWAWPALFLSFALLFRKQLLPVPLALAEFLRRATKISTPFGEFEADQLGVVVVEREELRLAALVATAGRESAALEIKALRFLALKLGAYKQTLEPDQIKYLLQFGFNLAMENKELEEEEREVLIEAGVSYGWSEENTKEYICHLEERFKKRQATNHGTTAPG